MKCSSCGKDLSNHAKFCPDCGEPVREPTSLSLICDQCGYEAQPGASFCRACGNQLSPAPAMPEHQSTKSLELEEKPATDSPSRETPQQQPKSSRKKTTKASEKPPQTDTTSSAKPSKKSAKNLPDPVTKKALAPQPVRKKGSLLKGLAALGLSGILLVQCFPDFLENPPWSNDPGSTQTTASKPIKSTAEGSVYESVILTEAELATPGETTEVSPEAPVAAIKGATVDFGAYALEKKSSLKVSRLPEKVDQKSGTSFAIYNFQLNGADHSEFPVVVDITLPYDGKDIPEEEEADRISIAYYDKEQQTWLAYPSTVDNDKDLVTFSTTHFSPYGVLKDAKGGFAESELIKLFMPFKNSKGPAAQVYTTSNRIDQVVGALDQESLRPFIKDPKIVSNPTHRFWFSVTADSINGVGTLVDPPYIDDFIKKKPFELHGKVLGGLGILLTVSKVGYQLKNNDEPQAVLWDNMVNLCEAAATGLAIYYSSPVWGSIATGFWIWGLQDYAQYMNPDQPVAAAESNEEEFYRFFTDANMVWLQDSRKWVYSREQFDKSYTDYEPDYAKQLMSHNLPHTWAKIFRQIEDEHKFDPKGMAKTIDSIINQFCDAFWDVDGKEVLDHAAKYETGVLFKDNLEEFNWPDTAETQAWHQRFKAEVIHDLAPLFREMSRTAYEELRKEVFRQVLAAWPVLNELTDVSVEDPTAPSGFFPSSDHASDIMQFEPLKEGTKVADWTARPSANERSNTVFSYNLYHYLEAGAPTRLAFYKDKKQLKAKKPDLTVKFSYQSPEVILRLPAQDNSGYYAGDVRFTYSDGIPQQQSNYWIRAELKGDTLYVVPCKDNGSYSKDLVMACTWDATEKAWIGKKSGTKAGETTVYAISFQKLDGKEAVVGKIMIRDPDEHDGSWEDHNADYEFAAVKVHPLSWYKK